MPFMPLQSWLSVGVDSCIYSVSISSYQTTTTFMFDIDLLPILCLFVFVLEMELINLVR